MLNCVFVQDINKKCGFFKWIDPELPSQYYKDILVDVMEGSHLKIMKMQKITLCVAVIVLVLVVVMIAMLHKVLKVLN